MMRKNEEDGKKDFFTVIMIVQIALCVLLVAGMVISFNGSGKFLETILESYNALMEDDFTEDDAKAAFSEIIGVVTVENKNQNELYLNAAGGKDIEFSSLETLEGISFENIDTDFFMELPLKDFVVTSDFGYRYNPVTGEPGIHTGIDMAADYGVSIYAAADGVVADADWDNSYGKYVKLLHKDNTISIYAHCSSLCVSEGETVSAGEKIAEVGSTGASTGNHLHFEVRKDNIRVNPRNYIDEEIKA